jgi:hypothetical protein
MINDRSLFGPENDRRVLDARELRAAICTIWWLRRVGAGASERLLPQSVLERSRSRLLRALARPAETQRQQGHPSLHPRSLPASATSPNRNVGTRTEDGLPHSPQLG